MMPPSSQFGWYGSCIDFEFVMHSIDYLVCRLATSLYWEEGRGGKGFLKCVDGFWCVCNLSGVGADLIVPALD